eukprot:CAMPEP_0184388068 /NCGR_PEP_ID=MMETSP0007-20130409/11284_1 /TAXON_ID=97485 /ORGANISM="Prymnesium parvum, Strain Texoma1" /LENGTH=45 /DNA_ID= /DNA_START= /DNA_END= /DNA_ORIENTATION=
MMTQAAEDDELAKAPGRPHDMQILIQIKLCELYIEKRGIFLREAV